MVFTSAWDQADTSYHCSKQSSLYFIPWFGITPHNLSILTPVLADLIFRSQKRAMDRLLALVVAEKESRQWTYQRSLE
jgi:hypothetical protein